MYCKHCGKEIDDNSSFCKYCGKAQDNRVSTYNGLIDFFVKKPIVPLYILWVIINTVCLSLGNKWDDDFNMLYPKFDISWDPDFSHPGPFSLDFYLITDYIVYTLLIPLVIFLGYHFFKKVTSIKYRILWALWFIFHITMYKISDFASEEYFFPFIYDDGSWGHGFVYPLFAYDAYDLSELVFYTMIIPIAYWGYLYYKDKKKGIKDIK